MTKLAAITPGEFLLEEFLRPNGLTQKRLSQAIDVPRSRVSGLVRGTRSITADTALRLSAFFGTTAEFWMNLQAEFDLRQARATSWPAIAPRIVPHRAA